MKQIKIIALTFLCSSYITQPVTIVYNMRIATITRKQKLDASLELLHVLGGTVFRQWRTFGTDATETQQTTAGLLGTYIYAKESYYLKIDSAVGHVDNKTDMLNIARTQADDLLFTGGYGHNIGKKWRMAYSGLLGIPTHRDFILELAQFGTGHVGLGGQLDTSYDYRGNHRNVIFGAVRWVHFLSRTVEAKDPRLKSLFPCNQYKLNLGDVVDLFISHQTNWKLYNRFECGYDATFGFNASITPAIANFAGTANLIRNSFFGAYFRYVPIGGLHTGIILGLSYGFDSKPELAGSKYFVTLWGSWGLSF